MWEAITITAEPLRKGLWRFAGLKFEPGTDRRVSPSQSMAAIARLGTGLQQINGQWGARRPGSDGLVTTAEAEKTGPEALQSHRCLIPCSGWIESAEDESRFHFYPEKGAGLLLTGLWFGDPSSALFVVLTMAPARRRAGLPSCMPLLLPPDKVRRWLDASPPQLKSLLQSDAPVALESAKIA